MLYGMLLVVSPSSFASCIYHVLKFILFPILHMSIFKQIFFKNFKKIPKTNILTFKGD